MKLHALAIAAFTFGLAACGGGGGGGGGGGAAGSTGPTSFTSLGRIVACTRDMRLISFEAGRPETIFSSVAITGLQPNEWVIGLDFRASTGELYALGTSSRLYRIDPVTAVATSMTSAPFTPNVKARTAAFDVDPVRDVVRVAIESDRNVRLDPETGQFLGEDTLLSYAPADALFPADPNVAGLAYTNDYAGASSTTAYAIDTGTGMLVRIGDVGGFPQSGAGGQLHTIGSLGIDTSGISGFDISPAGGALCSATLPGTDRSQLYALDLATGAAQLLGTIGAGTNVRALAIRPATAPRIFALSESGNLVSFRPGRPGTLLATHAVTGLLGGESLLSIDFRAEDGRLYGLGSTSRLYRIDAETAVATAVSAAPFSTLVTGTGVGFDVAPGAGTVRIVDDDDQNLSIDAATGEIANVDLTLAFGSGDVHEGHDPMVIAIAHTLSGLGDPRTTLYGLDMDVDLLVRIGSTDGDPETPATGQLHSIGHLTVNFGPLTSFDIDANGVAFAALDVSGSADSVLVTVDLSSGFNTPSRTIAGGKMRGIAIEPAPAPLVFGVAANDTLVTFRATNPSTILSSMPITGLEAGETLVAIDFRASTNDLIGVGSMSRVYSIDLATGDATALGPMLTPALMGVRVAAEVDPLTSHLRIVSDMEENLAVDLTSAMIVDVGAPLDYVAGDGFRLSDPRIVAIAHSHNATGAGTTTAYVIDAGHDTLAVLGATSGPASGELSTVGPLDVDCDDLTGFDIGSDGTALVSVAAGTSTQLYSIDLESGLATPLGTIGGQTLRDIAIVPTAP